MTGHPTRGSRLVGSATDIIDLGAGDFAEIKRRMNYGDTRRLAGMFTGPAPMNDYLAGVLEVNVVALRGPGFGCALDHDHADPAQNCAVPPVDRAQLDDLDPDDADALIDAIATRNASLRRQVRQDADPFPKSERSSSPTSSDTVALSPSDSPMSPSVSEPTGPGTSS